MNKYKMDGMKECLNIVSGQNKPQLSISDEDQTNEKIQNFLSEIKSGEQKAEVTLAFSEFLVNWFVENAKLLND